MEKEEVLSQNLRSSQRDRAPKSESLFEPEAAVTLELGSIPNESAVLVIHTPHFEM